MPGRFVIGSVHDEADRSGRITVAENFRKLSVRHYSAGGNLTDYAVNALSVLGVWRSVHWFRIAGLHEGPQDGPRRRAVSAASCDLEWQADQFIRSRRHRPQIEAFENHDTV